MTAPCCLNILYVWKIKKKIAAKSVVIYDLYNIFSMIITVEYLK